MPLIEIARAATKAAAMEGLERWKARHAQVWPHLAPEDVLVNSMRGRSSTWTRIRINLQQCSPSMAARAFRPGISASVPNCLYLWS